MKRSLATRLFAFLLVICMLISLAPTGFTADTTKGKDYIFDLGRLRYGQWSDQGASPTSLTDWEALEKLGNWDKITTDPYMFYGKSETAEWRWTSSSGQIGKYGARGPEIYGKTGDWVGLIVRLDEGGVFTPWVRYANVKGIYDENNYYLAPLGASDPRAEQFLLGSGPIDSIDTSALGLISFGERCLPAGDYVFIAEVVDGVADMAYSAFGALQLKNVSAEPSSRLEISLDVETTDIEEETKIGIDVTLDGEAVALSDLDALRIDSLDGEVATIREIDGEYYVYGEWTGETKLWVEAKLGDEMSVATAPISVVMPQGFKRVELFAGEQPDAYFMFDDITVDLTTKFNREVVTPEKNDFTISVADPSLAKAIINDNGDLIVTGLLAGETEITVTATYNGASGSITLPIVVGGVKYFYNFLKAYYGPWSNSAYHPSVINSFEKTTTGGVGEIKAANFPQTSDPWMYGGIGGMFNPGVTSSFKDYGYLATGGPGDWLNFKIKVSEGGVYSLDMVFGKQNWGSSFDIYFSPDETPAEMLTNEKYYMARVDTASSGTALDQVKSVGNVTVEPGVYNVTWQLAKDTLVGYGGMMMGMKLSAVTTDNFRLFTPTPDPVMETADHTVPLTAIWNGAEVDFSDVTDLSVSSANAKVATGEIVRDGDTAGIKINGIAAGKTTFTVSGVRNGAQASYKFNVDIAEKKRIYSVSLTTEKQNIEAQDVVETTLSGVYYDGTPIDFTNLDIYYESLNFDVAQVSENGVITAKKKGEATVRVWVQQGETLLHSVLPISVGMGKVTEVTFDLPEMIQRGKNTTLKTTVKTASGEILDDGLYSVVYSIESAEPAGCVRTNAAVTTLQGRALGRATLKAVVTVNGDEYVITKTTEVVNKLPESEEEKPEQPKEGPEKILLKLDKTSIGVGESIGGEMGVYYFAGNLVPYSANNDVMTLTFNEEVLSYVDGVFVAIAPGTTDITLSAGEDVTATVSVTVTDEVLGSAQAKYDGILYTDATVGLAIDARTNLGRAISTKDLTLSFVSENTAIATVDSTGVVTGVSAGDTTVTVTATLAESSVVIIVPVHVVENAAKSITLTAPVTVMKPNSTEGIQTSISVVSTSGDIRPADVSEVTFESLNEEVLTVDANGLVLPNGIVGSGVIRATFNYNGTFLTSDLTINVKEGKTGATFFTKERCAAIRENAASFDWAKQSYNSVKANAEPLAGKEDEIIEFMTTNELPRSIWTGLKYDPTYQNCNYCGVNIIESSGNGYPWKFDYENYPWKLQCPNCMRRFPSNDFWSFYKTGIDEYGNWSYELAKQNGSHLLTNDSFPEMDEHIDKNGVLQNEGVHGWGVDDGYGYRSGETYETQYGTWEYADVYIAYYNHWANWYSGGKVYNAISRLMYGYAYTGDIRYGRSLAVIVDRAADLYPDMNTGDFLPEFNNNGWFGGKIVGGIWETGVINNLSKAYDVTFELYDDPYVLNKIQANAAKWKQTNKGSAAEIRQHIEDDLLRETRAALYDKRINGNSGMHQSVAVTTAVVLDNMPETKELIDWALTGFGEILPTLVSGITREGQGTECSPGYNNGWVNLYSNIAETLGAYQPYQEVNLYNNPRYLAMLKMNLPLTMTRNYTLNIGDTGGFATLGFHFDTTAIGTALVNGCDDPELAQILYFMNGNSASGPNGRSIMVSTKELEDKVQRLIDEYGEYDFDKSTQMTGYGAGMLRGGTFIADNKQNYNTQRSVSLWYGGQWGHSQEDCLSLMMDAYGLNVMPAMGYPTDTSGTNKSVNWESATISHNTVVVNGDRQQEQWYVYGDPLHFDDSGRVKLVDAQHNSVYAHQGVSKYRRTAVVVEVNDEDAYTLDFFRVKGGNSHLYSFHGNSNEVSDYEWIQPVSQPMGTYAGPDVPFGPGVLRSGYDALYDVQRAVYPGNKFSVEFKINDFRGVLKENREIYLRMTQINDFELSDVSIATGNPPYTNDNPSEIKYVLARRDGQNLDSLFTTVIEPYDRTRYIESIEGVDIVRTGGAKTEEPAKAVKVTLKNGRVDYIVYSSNNKTRFRVDDKFDFIGYVGVISYEGDHVSYRYMHDSTMLDGMYYDSEATGKVTSFTKGLATENFINVRFDKAVNVDEMVGKTIFVQNGGSGSTNGAYWIRSATENLDGTVSLGLGSVTTVISMDTDGNYTYNIKEGQAFRIPLTSVDDSSPIVEPIENQVASVGDTLSVPIVAISPSGKELTYRVSNNIVGATMQGNVFCFSPHASQENVAVSIEVSDGVNTTTVVFGVEVFGSGASDGGGGSSGGNGGDSSDDEVTYTDLGNNIFKDSDGNLIDAGPDKTPGTADDKPYEEIVTPTEKFVDLGNHAWAKEAIYRLVDAGVIKGVAEDKFAPATQITRADFAILLVRAWDLTADEPGTYDDVAETDYFANEVGIASALGIVKGVGEGRFAPKAPITREQMMVMLSRTLEAVKTEVKEVEDDVLESFTDADLILDYAVDAVRSMVGNGFVQGSDGKINPQGNATRAEVAVLLDRILN